MATPSWVPYGNVRPGGGGGAGRWVPGGLLALVWGSPVTGLSCERWAREELELMLVTSAVLLWVQAGLRGMAPAGQ